MNKLTIISKDLRKIYIARFNTIKFLIKLCRILTIKEIGYFNFCCLSFTDRKRYYDKYLTKLMEDFYE